MGAEMRHHRLYYVMLYKFRELPHGNSNFIVTPYLGRARYYAKRLKVRDRQIDVRERGRAYVLAWSSL
jgi:hypothetical protein